MKAIALILALLSSSIASAADGYYPAPHLVWTGDEYGFQSTFQPTILAASLVSASGLGNDWAAMAGAGGGAVMSPNAYAGLLVCTANCSDPYRATWQPWTGSGGGGGTGTVNSGTAFAPTYYPATGSAVSGATPFNGLAKFSTTAAPTAAIPGTDYVIPSGTVANASNVPANGIVSTYTSYPSLLKSSPFSFLRAFGDSNTYGVYEQRRNSYVGQEASILGLGDSSYDDLGISGSVAAQNETTIYGTPCASGIGSLCQYMIGTNDVTAGVADANYQATFGINTGAQAAYIAIPAAKKIIGSGAVSTTGTWVAGTFTVSKRSTTNGNTITFTTPTAGTTVLVATSMIPSNAATASLSCDGTATGVTPLLTGSGGSTYGGQTATGYVAVTGLANTVHTCVLTQTATGTLEFDWASAVSTIDNTYPTFQQLGIIDRNPTDANTPAYRTQQSTAIATLRGYGLTNATYVDTSGTTSTYHYYDGLHGDSLVYYQIASKAITALNTSYSTGVFIPPFRGAYVLNNVRLLGGVPTALPATSFGIGAYALNAYTGTSNAAYVTAGGVQSYVNATTAQQGTAWGGLSCSSVTSGNYNDCFGYNSGPVSGTVTFTQSIGAAAHANATGAAQIGQGTNATANTLQYQTWNFLDASGNGRFNSITIPPETVAFSATPTFSAVIGTTRLVLTGNVISSTLAAGTDGAQKTFQICQDAPGSRTFTWPATVKGGMTIGSVASTCSLQTFTYSTASGYAFWYANSLGVINQ